MFGGRRVARRTARRTSRRTARRQNLFFNSYDDEPYDEPAPMQAAPQEPEEPAYVAELEHLSQLKNQGILTQEEYDAKKKQILGL